MVDGGRASVPSRWARVRSWLVVVGVVAWFAGPNYGLFHLFDTGRFLLGWLVAVAGFGLTVSLLLPSLLRGDSRPPSLRDALVSVPRRAGVPVVPVVVAVVAGLSGLHLQLSWLTLQLTLNSIPASSP